MQKKSFINKALRLFVVLLISLVIVLAVSINIFYRSLRNSLSESASNYLTLYGKDVDATVNEAERLLDDMIYDNTDYVLLSSDNETTRYYAVMSLKKELNNLIMTDYSANLVCIAEDKYQNFVMAERFHTTNSCREDAMQYMFASVAKGNSKSEWNYVSLGGEYYLCKLYVWQGRGAGVFVPVSKLLTEIDASANVALYLLDNENKIIGCTGAVNSQFEVGQTYEALQSRTVVAKKYNICDNRFSLESQTSFRQMTNQVKSEGVMLILVVVFLLLFAVIGGRQLRKQVVNPMLHIQDNMKRIQDGDYMHRIEDEYPNEEFESLKFTFNKMMDEIVELKINHYEKQIELSESELRSIRLQIRPHFFLNALTTISSLSMQNKNSEIATYIEALSKNVRYMFKSGIHTVELSEELTHVENYFEMQELKYPNAVFYFISCPEDLYSWKVPQMIIHTIIENEYKYAVSVDSLLSIFINIEAIEKDGQQLLKIEIQDDGKGYPEDIIESIKRNEKRSQDGSRVGLWSIKKMLEIMYEQDDLFTISNIEPHGCNNTILIPKEPKHEVGQKIEMKPLE